MTVEASWAGYEASYAGILAWCGQTYLESRSSAVQEVESHIAELGLIFNKLATMLQDQREMVERYAAIGGPSGFFGTGGWGEARATVPGRMELMRGFVCPASGSSGFCRERSPPSSCHAWRVLADLMACVGPLAGFFSPRSGSYVEGLARTSVDNRLMSVIM